MFAIVYKGRVILGPVGWNQKYFMSVLRTRHGITGAVPSSPPNSLPHVVDDDTTIHAVTDVKPSIDLMTEYYEGPIWDMSEPVLVAHYEARSQLISDAKQNFRALAADERYRKEVSAVQLEVQGQIITADTSRDGRAIFLQAYTVMPVDGTINWKFPEAWMTLTKAELGLVVMTGVGHIQAAFDWEKSINDQIDAAQTMEELRAIPILPQPEPEPSPPE